MIQFGCAIPGGSLMPEGVAEVPTAPDVQICEKCRAVLHAGFDFTECGGGMLACLDAAQRENLMRENARESLRLLAVNSLFPGHYRLADPSCDKEEYLEYAVRLLDTMRELGAKYAVLGSGSARSIQGDRYSADEGLQTLSAFITELGREADARGITVVIEPLRRAETNIFVTVPESGDYVRKLNQPGVKLLCDAFHMAEEGTDVSCVAEYADLLRHCHIAEAPLRTRPGSPDSGDLSYNRRFAEGLMKAGYNGGVSVECGFSNFSEDIRLAHAYLHDIFY
ncbi:MAG: sugar phosphate isomerase/epimerase [Ruminococcaceae bacterium]|nr:sugar phosphate isomerase/epimerase [Oscillospiraceae bacterium]